MSTPAFAQEGGGLDLIEMFEQMGVVAMAIAVVLFIMSFWSVGVAIERIYTFSQAKKQSKLYAPQVAKHLKEGRLKEAIALLGQGCAAATSRRSCSPACRSTGSSRRAAPTSREDILDTVRRSIRRATALTSNDLKKGVSASPPSARPRGCDLLGTRSSGIHQRVRRYRVGATTQGGIAHLGRYRQALVETASGASSAVRRVVLQLPVRPPRVAPTWDRSAPRRRWSTTSSRRPPRSSRPIAPG
ncbi:MAG: hypothetical protein R2712_23345 [Vicinamibacterales bacterium]